MKKITIIVGPQGCGKTSKAREIAATFNKEEVVYLSGRSAEELKEDQFLFNACTPQTKLIVFDEVRSLGEIVSFIISCTSPTIVNKRGKKCFQIEPNFIFISQNDEYPLDFIDLPNFCKHYINWISLNH